jgi:hypothetical protein
MPPSTRAAHPAVACQSTLMPRSRQRRDDLRGTNSNALARAVSGRPPSDEDVLVVMVSVITFAGDVPKAKTGTRRRQRAR